MARSHLPWHSHAHTGNPFALPYPGQQGSEQRSLAAPPTGTHFSHNSSCPSLGLPSPTVCAQGPKRALGTQCSRKPTGQSCEPPCCSSSALVASLQLPGLLAAVHFRHNGTGGPNDLSAMLLQEENPCTLTPTIPRLTLISMVSRDKREAIPLQKGIASPLGFPPPYF